MYTYNPHCQKRQAEGGNKMETLRLILTIIEVIASIALVVVVLMQSGKESGLSGAVTGNSGSFMNKSKSGNRDKKLATWTKWIAVLWILLTLSLSVVSLF